MAKRKPLDEEMFLRLASLGCTLEEMAYVLDAPRQLLERHGATIEKGRALQRVNIRRQQYQLLTKGNVKMAIWLGKCVLGQRETQLHEHTGKDGGPIATSALPIEYAKLTDDELRTLQGIAERAAQREGATYDIRPSRRAGSPGAASGNGTTGSAP